MSKKEKILMEMPEKRDRYTKHFRTERKGGVAAIYPTPVHYQEDGQWKEIDNRLESVWEDGKEIYRNRSSAVKVRFAKNPQDSRLVTIEKEGHKISWGLKTDQEKDFHVRLSVAESTSDAMGEIENAIGAEDTEKLQSKALKEKMSLPHLKSEGTYEDILDGIDLSYILLGERLKENIVLKTKEAAKTQIVFHISHKGLELKNHTDGSIGLYHGEELIFEFVRPYMYDASGEFSYAVTLEAEANEEESVLKLIPDSAWLDAEQRVYPVVIDPMTETSKDVKNVQDTFVSQNYQGAVNGNGSFVIGKNSEYGASRALLRFKNLPVIDKGSIIYAAQMSIWQYGFSNYGVTKVPLMAHQMTADWQPSTVTWNNTEGYPETVLDYKEIENLVPVDGRNPVVEICFDITKVVRHWYNEGQNNGILIRSALEFSTTQAEQAYGRFVASDFPLDSVVGISEDQYPCGMIYYRNVSGLEDYQSYHKQPLGRAGCGYTNDYTGNIVWVHSDAATSGNILPAGLNHVYNLSDCDTRYFGGYGWRLSAMQELKDSGMEDYPYVYIDADGTKHYFYKNPDKETEFLDEDGLGLTITQTSSTDYDAYRIMTTKDKYTYTFGGDNYLREIKDPDGNKQTYTYSQSPVSGKENQLIYIMDAAGAFLTLAYDEAGDYLTSVTDEAGRKTTYSYDVNGNLQSITYPDGKASGFAYDADHQLIAVRNVDTRKIEYELKNDFQVPRVSKVTQRGDDSALGGAAGETGYEMKISYKNGNTTVFEEPGLDGTLSESSDNRKIIYHFDNLGRPFSVIHDDGSANNFEYYSEGMKNNRLGNSGSTQKTVYSLLKNPCMDMSQAYLGADGWDAYASENTTYYYSVERLEAKDPESGPRFKELGLGYMQVASGLTDNRAGFQQSVTLEPGTYTFSAYVCVSQHYSGDGGVSIEIMDDSGNVLAKSNAISEITDTDICGGWERLSVTFVLESQTTIRALGIMEGMGGTAQFTGMQLETGSVPNKLNLINNPGFRKIDNSVPIGWSYNTTDTNERYVQDAEKGASAKLVGEIDKEKSVYQIVNIRGEEGDVYSISGWAKGAGIPGKDFMLAAKITYEDNTEKWHEFPFNPNVTDWQFVNGTFRTDDDSSNTKKKYISITVMLIYHNQANEVLFNGIQLTRDDGASYVYDDNGNLVSAKSAAVNSGFVNNKDDNMTKMTDISGTSFEYVYDEKKHIEAAKNSQGVRYQFEYDDKGRAVSTVVQGGRRIQAAILGRAYYIREKVSGNYLHVKDEGTASGTAVVLGTFNGRAAHQWSLVEEPDGQYLIVPKHAEDICLHLKDGSDTDYAGIQVCTKDESNAQHWKLNPIEDGFYQISCKATNNMRGLTNPGSSTTNGHGVQNCTLVDSYDNQKWYFEPVEQEGETYSDVPKENKIYAIRVRHSGQYLQMADTGTAAGDHLVTDHYNGSAKQQFYFEKGGVTGLYYLRPVSAIQAGNELVLAVSGVDEEGYPTVCLAEKGNGSDMTRMFFFKKESTDQNYLICHATDGAAMDVKYSAYAAGQKVVMLGYDDIASVGTNKQWILEELSDRITSNLTYTSVKGHVAAVVDSRGNVTTNTYDSDDRLLLSTKDSEDHVTSYTYDSNDRLLTVTGSTGSQNISVAYEYEDDRLSRITHNGFSYEFDYDVFGNRTSTSVAGQELTRTEYRPHNGLPDKYIYGNGFELRNEYDKKEQLVAQYKKESGETETQLYANTYDDNGYMLRHEDIENGITTEFQYDLIGRITGSNSSSDSKIGLKDLSQSVSYDEKNRVSSRVQKLDDGTAAIRTGYRYGDPEKGEEPGLIYGITVDSVEKVSFEYDTLGRIVKKIQNPGTSAEYVTEYTYVKGAKAGTTTLLVETVKAGDETLRYTYDKRGNITKIETLNAQGTSIGESRFVYDGLGQLIREDNAVTGKTETYAYDGGGNITSRKVYNFTSGEVGTVTDTKNYVYSGALSTSVSGINNGWKDLLIAYGDEMDDYIQYDNAGNMLKYRGRSFTWARGRRLANIKNDAGLNILFKYDQKGNRVLKTSLEGTVKYYVDGGYILALETAGKTVQFLYDQDGEVFALKFKPSGSNTVLEYYYLHNLQGDVTGLIDSSGNQVVSYKYDSWGKPLSVTDTSGYGIGTLNPFRYRGYCYDEETGYYYLKSRYFDPEACRFLSADSVMASVGRTVKGYNLFAYCFNDPISMDDADGNWPRRKKKTKKKKTKSRRRKKTNSGRVKATSMATSIKRALYQSSTALLLHTKVRSQLNEPYPTYDEVKANKTKWTEVSEDQTKYHDNGIGEPEEKYTHADGREAVFDGDTYLPMTDPRYIATFNYCPIVQLPEKEEGRDMVDYAVYAYTTVKHGIYDVLPYILLGNDAEDPTDWYERIMMSF